jgi:hypothetical protein
MVEDVKFMKILRNETQAVQVWENLVETYVIVGS